MLRKASERADAADVRGVQSVLTDIRAQDRALGGRRQESVNSLIAAVEAQLDAARQLRLARDHWASRLPAFEEYRDSVWMTLERFMGLRPLLEDIRSLAGPSISSLATVESSAAQNLKVVGRVTPPTELRDAHALLASAAQMAASAARLRLEAVGTNNMLADDLRTLARPSPTPGPPSDTGAAAQGSLFGDESPAGGEQPYESREQQAGFRVLFDRVRAYFLTQDGRPRGGNFMGTGFNAGDCSSAEAWKRHRAAAAMLAPLIAETVRAFRRDLNVVLSRGVWRIYAVALKQHDRTLDSRALLDFSGVLEKAIRLLRDMDEFAESRFRLESRYRHGDPLGPCAYSGRHSRAPATPVVADGRADARHDGSRPAALRHRTGLLRADYAPPRKGQARLPSRLTRRAIRARGQSGRMAVQDNR